MEAFKARSSSSVCFQMISVRRPATQLERPILNLQLLRRPGSFLSSNYSKEAEFKLLTAIPSAVSTELTDPSEPKAEIQKQDEKFDWYSHWYPIMPACDLDKRKPHGKRVMGIDVVVWWDRSENNWKVFDDSCPHRLAPLSEGRIDQWGRLQCVYHGWCFGGSGDCKFIPQAPRDGPPVHTSNRACVAVYPSCVQNGIVWFWPNSDPEFKNIAMKKKPPYIPELDDPSYTNSFINRDIQYGYEVLVENLMDPAHVPYSHYRIMTIPRKKNSVKADREGGIPLEISIQKLDVNGFIAKQESGGSSFVPPCLFYFSIEIGKNVGDAATASSPGTTKQKRSLLVFICVPVSPGNSRIIFASPRNFAVWVDKIVPRWMFHVGQNLILDSDLYLLHVEERKIEEIGSLNWQKACYVPTKSDAMVVAFRKWLNKFSGGKIDWRSKYSGALPSTPPRKILMDRYWTHTVNCKSCSAAYKGLNGLEIALQVIAVGSIGIVVTAKQNMAARTTPLVALSVICFAASKWLSHFVYKNFHYHDYDHTSVQDNSMPSFSQDVTTNECIDKMYEMSK